MAEIGSSRDRKLKITIFLKYLKKFRILKSFTPDTLTGTDRVWLRPGVENFEINIALMTIDIRHLIRYSITAL